MCWLRVFAVACFGCPGISPGKVVCEDYGRTCGLEQSGAVGSTQRPCLRDARVYFLSPFQGSNSFVRLPRAALVPVRLPWAIFFRAFSPFSLQPSHVVCTVRSPELERHEAGRNVKEISTNVLDRQLRS